MKSKRNIDRRRLSALIPAAFLTFTFCIFGPVELYISNITELWFGLDDILLPSIFVGLISCGVLFLIGFFLPEKLQKWYCCLLIGLGIALYIQGNFIQINYGVLDGREIQWEDYGSVAVWDTAIWIVCLALPFAAQTLLKDKFKKIASTILCCVLLVQVITLGTLIITTDFSKYGKDGVYLSRKNLYTVSSEKNVIVFVLDTFDQEFLEEIIAERPDILEPLDGFTWYTNMTCSYPTTQASVPLIMTGQYYKNEQPYRDYIEEAYQNIDFYEKLHEMGYSINLYTMDMFVSNDMKRTMVENAEMGEISVNNYVGLETAMLQFAAFRYFPHIAKQFVWFYSGIFDQYKDLSRGVGPYPWDNVAYYSGLKAAGLQTISNSNSFIFIHLYGTHPPYTLNENIETVGDMATSTTQGIACLKIVYEYISQLKELGLYDNTMMMIAADHGMTGESKTWPIFLLKGFGSSGPVNTSNVPVSQKNILPTIIDECGLNCDDQYEKSVKKVLESDTVSREYFYYRFQDSVNKEYMPDMTEYIGDAQRNFAPTGTVYTMHGIERDGHYKYTVGDYIEFTEKENGCRYFTEGICSVEGNLAWSLGKSGQLILNLGDQTSDLVGEFRFTYVYGAQRLAIRCGDLTLYEDIVSSADVRFVIPANCVKDGMLILNLEYPDAVSPESLGKSSDHRLLAFAFQSIRVCSADEIWADEHSYQLNSMIVFTDDDNGCRYFAEGISSVEENFAWSLGTTGKMHIEIEENVEQLTGEFQFRAIFAGPQRFVVRCGDLVLYDKEVSSVEEAVRFTIPGSCVKDGTLTLELEYPNAVSPKSKGKSEDSRELAFAFRSIRFYQSEG